MGTLIPITKTVKLVSTNNIEAGDLLIQPYYLNASRFNALLSKLDQDPGVIDNDYYSTLKVIDKSGIPQAIVALANKLNDDLGLNSSYTASLQSSPKTIQAEFNRLIDILTDDTSVVGTYATSKNSSKKEVGILEVDKVNSELTVAYDADLSDDVCYIQKAIPTKIEWVPQHAGDASINKQFSEAQFMFSEASVKDITVGFKTEISQYFEEVTIEGNGTGAWGLFKWGQKAWGISGSSEDMRTLVPSNKQRCRLINCQIRHVNAYESFSMVGLALVFRATGFRVNN